MSPSYVSAFSGVGGFELGFQHSAPDWSCTLQIENDPHCRRVLDQHFPDVPKEGDIRDVHDIGRPDVLLGGFPCQDTSIGAPHRRGLDGDRSGLFWEFHRLLASAEPRWAVIENPEGLLRSRQGRDAAAVFRGLEDLGYGWAYRVVDGRYLGTPQRRRRVLVVAHRGGDPGPAWAVLGDDSPGEQTPGPDRLGRPEGGPRAVPGPVGPDGALIFRKSARPRAALSKGGYETWVPADFANTLTGFDGGLPTRQTHLIVQGSGVRTLTATEWERLQGFPDDWTAAMPASARWQALGNAIHVGTAAWLARRLNAVHRSTSNLSDRREVMT